MVKLLALAALLIITFFARAQDFYTVDGVVGDSITQKPVEFVLVAVKQKASEQVLTTSTTDAKGAFEIKNLAAGEYELIFSLVGYTTKRVALQVQGDKHLGNVPMSVVSQALGEAVVTAQKAVITRNSEKTVFHVAESPTSQTGNAEDVLRNMPGVSVDQKGNISIVGKQGVKILVDGKPNAMAENNLAAFLKSIPANAIEAIELITNPSAKYDAEGNAGIVNIKLKKGRADGLNANISAAYGILNRYSGTGAINYRKDKINVFADFSVNYVGMNNRYIESRKIGVNDTVTYYDLNSKSKENRTNATLKTGFDYTINDKTSFTYTLSGDYSVNRWFSRSESYNRNLYRQLINSYISTDDERGKNGSISNELSLSHKFDTTGNEISAAVIYSYVQGQNNAPLISNAYDSAGNYSEVNSLLRRTDSRNNIHNVIAQLDYVYPFKKLEGHKIEAGVKDEATLNENAFDAYRTVAGVENHDSLLSNNFKYIENISAVYGIYNGGYKQLLTWSAGLRAEHTYIRSTNNTTNRNYISFFPSASLEANFKEMHSIGIRYSRRIQRPEFRQINNTVAYIDQYSTWQGNPYLQPSFSHILSLSYSAMVKQHMFVVEAVGNWQTGGFIESSRVDSNRITRGGNINGADSKTIAINFYFRLQLTKWWDLQMNHSYSYNAYSYKQGINLAPINGSQYSLWASTSFKFWKNASLEINGWFNSKGVQSQGLIYPVGMLNASLRKSFFKDKFTVSIAGNNLLNTMKWHWTVNNNNLQTDGSWQSLSRHVTITLSYLFGNKQSLKREDKGGNERLGGGGKGR
ncbi:MAG: outer membrane beta-barrel protein [Chitinophagales bacterium]